MRKKGKSTLELTDKERNLQASSTDTHLQVFKCVSKMEYVSTIQKMFYGVIVFDLIKGCCFSH